MTTTPLPPFPRPSVYDPGRFGVAYSQAQMVDFATQARADLEAENKRLREALQNIKHMKTFAIETTSVWCQLATEMVEIASTALKEQP